VVEAVQLDVVGVELLHRGADHADEPLEAGVERFDGVEHPLLVVRRDRPLVARGGLRQRLDALHPLGLLVAQDPRKLGRLDRRTCSFIFGRSSLTSA